MNPEKKQVLENTGWKIGSVEEFLDDVESPEHRVLQKLIDLSVEFEENHEDEDCLYDTLESLQDLVEEAKSDDWLRVLTALKKALFSDDWNAASMLCVRLLAVIWKKQWAQECDSWNALGAYQDGFNPLIRATNIQPHVERPDVIKLSEETPSQP